MSRISAVTRSGRELSPGKLLEKQVTQQVKDFLLYRGWRAVRMQRTAIPGAFSTGEPGIPDILFLRYLPDAKPAAALALWVEFKRPGGQLRKGQPEWHERERMRGATVIVVDDLQWFIGEYDRLFGWLHSSDTGRGQLDLLASV